MSVMIEELALQSVWLGEPVEAVLTVFLTVTDKKNSIKDEFAYVSSNSGVRCAHCNTSLHFSPPVPLPGQDCGLNTTTSSKPCRVSPHFVGRHAVVVKDRFQATSLNKYLVIFVAWRLNVICRTNTTARSRSKKHTCYPASQYLRGC